MAGQLDPTFGTGGKVRTDINGNDDLVGGLTMQFGILPVVAGVSIDAGGNTNVAVARYLPNGNPDPTFGNHGFQGVFTTTSNVGPEDFVFFGEITGVTTQSDGKIVVVGDFASANLGQFIFLERLDLFGHPDLSFGNGGQVLFAPANPNLVISKTAGLVIQSNDRIVVAETITDISTIEDPKFVFAATRFKSNGSIDTYGSGGTAIADFGVSGAGTLQTTGIDLTPGGKVVLTGTLNNQNIGLAQFTTSGAPDTSFGGGTGKEVLTQLDTGSTASAITVGANGKILVAGSASTNFGDFLLLRLNANGTLDGSFGSGGVVTADFHDPTPLPPNSRIDGATSVAFDLFGRIVVGGTSGQQVNNGDVAIALARYFPNGTPDFTFGSGGQILKTFPNEAVGPPLSLAIGFDDKIVVATSIGPNPFNPPPFHDFLVARFLSDTFPFLRRASTPLSPESSDDTDFAGVFDDSGTVAVLTGDVASDGEAAPAALDQFLSSIGGPTRGKPDQSDASSILFDPFTV